MKIFTLISSVILLSLSLAAHADDATDCAAAKATFLSGTIISSPVFKPGKPKVRHGKHAELSHTHLTFKDAKTNDIYDVAIDNVFATGYDQAHHQVPAPLNTLTLGDTIHVCGITYNDNGKKGIHWVHTNCGAPSTEQKPNGFIKKLDAQGKSSKNLEANEEYCDLW